MQYRRGVNNRLESYCYRVMFEGPVEFSLLSQGQGQAVVSFGIVRVKPERLGETGQGLL